MSLRDGAALALAGWYLLSPPVLRLPKFCLRVNPAAHLKYWKVRGNYASIADCDVAARAIIALAKTSPDSLPAPFDDLAPEVMHDVMQNLVCIADDDPRLR